MSKKQFIEINGLNYELCLDPPKDDPDFPSYVQDICPIIADDLKLIDTIYSGSSKDLLKKWELESDLNFNFRKDLTLFTDFLTKAIKTFPGFLSDITNLDKLHPLLFATIKDVDGKGNDFASFFYDADVEAIKSGYCGLLLDCEKDELDSIANPSPYLMVLPRCDILSWSEYTKDRKTCYERITIKEYVNKKLGAFGTQQITMYKTFFDDGSYLTQVILVDEDIPYVKTIEEGQTCLTSIPIIFYSTTAINPTEARPPLESLARKNKAHYELYSEYRNIMFRLNNPAVVRTGLVVPGQTDFTKLPPVILSGSIATDVPIGGSLVYVEPTGRCLETDRAELDKLEESMVKDTLEFIFGGSDKTATEVTLSSITSKVNLTAMATLKQSAIEQVSELWGNYYGEYNTKGNCIINKDLLNIPLSSQDMQVLSSMVMADTLSNITFLELMNEGKRMPQGVTPAKEIKRIVAQKVVKQKLEAEMSSVKIDNKAGISNVKSSNNQSKK